MSIKVVVGGIIEKEGKFLLVKETKESCKNQWNIPAGGLDDNESLVEGAKREIFEETGCSVEIAGVVEIDNMILKDKTVIVFIFETKMINESVKVDGKEIADAKWFSYDEILDMKDELRENGYYLGALKKKIDNKVLSMDAIKSVRKGSAL